MVVWVLQSLSKNKNCKLPHTELPSNQDKREGKGTNKQTNLQNKIVNTSKSTHPIKFPSFFLFFFLIWLLRTKDPKSSTDCIYTIWNVRMSLCFYVQNSNGKDSLDLWSCSHRRNVRGEGKAGQLQVIIYTLKINPSATLSYITDFEILPTTTLDENHRIFLKITPT